MILYTVNSRNAEPVTGIIGDQRKSYGKAEAERLLTARMVTDGFATRIQDIDLWYDEDARCWQAAVVLRDTAKSKLKGGIG